MHVKKYDFWYNKKCRNYFLGLIFFFVLSNIIIFVVWRFIVWIGYIANSLPLSQLIITGQRIYTTNNDIRQSVLESGAIGTFMTQDVQRIQKRIKNLPWIKQVSVRKQWPDKIKVYIVEYIPVACWNDIYMITKDGNIFTIPEWRINKKLFPLLFGSLGQERDVLNHYYLFNEIVNSSIFKLRSVSIDCRYSYQIVLDNGVKLILGRENNVVRLQRFMKVYPVFLRQYMVKANEFISVIDLRYESGFSIRKVPIMQYKH